ncbi:SERGEF isoform 8 [Pan troglodytes]|uniref:Secretion regulating guanine nucleotide exchange factor n=2 Tax=Homininae TaxID=207598 RepID=E9PIV0_HUMAN|nr:secretion regulating guanine nucleotide exchange factor [Homo sapiens]PNI79085.1 SERGEF isoform 8 [Pan troglodytes]
MLTENGQVLSCGSNSFGQLGVPHGPRRCVVPQAIEKYSFQKKEGQSSALSAVQPASGMLCFVVDLVLRPWA